MPTREVSDPLKPDTVSIGEKRSGLAFAESHEPLIGREREHGQLRSGAEVSTVPTVR
jgi:hypothetical protein